MSVNFVNRVTRTIVEFKLTSNERAMRQVVIIFFVMVACGAVAPLDVGSSNKDKPVDPRVVEHVVSSSAADPIREVAQSHETPVDISVEIITIRPWGFEPSIITRPHTRLVLRVDNRSGIEEVALQLDHESGPRLREVRVPREKLDWSESLNLPPGRYFLREGNHPDWVCDITITSR